MKITRATYAPYRGEVQAGDVTFEVRAYSCWDKPSEPLTGKLDNG